MPLTAIKGPYIPRADGRLREWLDNFASVIARAPSAVGLGAGDGATIRQLAERYAAAYMLARGPGMRGTPAVKEKNLVRRQVWETVRPIAMRIKHNRGISDRLKIELGIYPPLESQSRISKPRTAPQLEVVDLGRGYHRLRFRDVSHPTRFAKPYGVVSMDLLIGVGGRPARSPETVRRHQTVTRHVFTVKFKEHEAGKTATYFARWRTRRGKTGPWSRKLTLTIV